eukprot:5806679-Prymnesium_polylepis.1
MDRALGQLSCWALWRALRLMLRRRERCADTPDAARRAAAEGAGEDAAAGAVRAAHCWSLPKCTSWRCPRARWRRLRARGRSRVQRPGDRRVSGCRARGSQ